MDKHFKIDNILYKKLLFTQYNIVRNINFLQDNWRWKICLVEIKSLMKHKKHKIVQIVVHLEQPKIVLNHQEKAHQEVQKVLLNN